MTTPNNTDVTGHYTGDLLERWDIGKSAFYDRLKYLGIQLEKGSSNKGYLTDEQVKFMDELDSHIKKTGKMEGFNNSSLVKNNDSNLVQSSDNNSLATGNEDEYSLTSPDEIAVETEEPDDGFDMDDAFRVGAEIKTRRLAMPNLMALAIADELTEEDLPPDLQQKLNAVREAVNPKWKPEGVAKQYVERMRQKRRSG